MVRQVRRTLDRGTTGNDDSYLLWIIRFFLEFNRLNDFKIPLVRFVDPFLFSTTYNWLHHTYSISVDTCSEALSTQNFHWVLGRVQHHLDMLTSDKQNIKLWEKRLSIAIQVHECRLRLCPFFGVTRNFIFMLFLLFADIKRIIQEFGGIASDDERRCSCTFQTIVKQCLLRAWIPRNGAAHIDQL